MFCNQIMIVIILMRMCCSFSYLTSRKYADTDRISKMFKENVFDFLHNI